MCCYVRTKNNRIHICLCSYVRITEKPLSVVMSDIKKKNTLHVAMLDLRIKYSKSEKNCIRKLKI